MRFRHVIAALLFLTLPARMPGTSDVPPRENADAAALRQRALRGDAQAQLELGFACFRGIGRKPDATRAAYWFAQAARQGLAEAQYNLALCHHTGQGVEYNRHLAAKLLEEAAKQELPEAVLLLAQYCRDGIPAEPDVSVPRPAVAPDYPRAAALFQKAVRSRCPGARRELAVMLLRHPDADAREKALPEAVKLLREAAEEERDAAAMLALADLHLTGTGVERDEKRMLSLLRQAAELGLAEARPKLAFALEFGLGAPPDPAAAFPIYQQAAADGAAAAKTRLAHYHLAGRYTVQDIPKALALYQEAAAAGEPAALTRLARFHQEGNLLPHDEKKAFFFLMQAAKHDHAEAQYLLAQAFQNGSGTPPDPAAAFYWYRQAAFRGEVRALLEAGRCHLEGRGTERDPEQAEALLKLALENGMTEAQTLLEKIPPRLKLPEAEEIPKFEFTPKR